MIALAVPRIFRSWAWRGAWEDPFQLLTDTRRVGIVSRLVPVGRNGRLSLGDGPCNPSPPTRPQPTP